MNNPMTASDSTPSSNDMSMLGSASMHRLPQRGGRPIVFHGTELAMAMSFTPEIPYWYEINIYRTNDQGFVVALRKFFQAEEETDIVTSWRFEDINSAFDLIETYDPAVDLRIPDVALHDAAAPELAAAAMALKAEINAARAHYAGLVGELFAEIEQAGHDFG